MSAMCSIATRQVAADAPGEENLFRFYQMDITLSPQLKPACISPITGMFSGIKQVLAFTEWKVLTSVSLSWRAGSRPGKLPLSLFN